MKKRLIILCPAVLLLLSGCAEKQQSFDPVAVFSQAEQNMRKEKFEQARKLYQKIQEKAPDRSYDADLMLRIGDTYFGEEKYDEALVEYRAFLNFHPVNRNAAYAQYQIAMCSFKQLPTIDRDPSITRSALGEFEKLMGKYPKSPYVDEAKKNAARCRDRLARYELYVTRFYYKKESYVAAIGRAERLLQDFPSSPAEKDALYYSGMSYLKLDEKKEAIRMFTILVEKYPAMQDKVGPLMNDLRKQ